MKTRSKTPDIQSQQNNMTSLQKMDVDIGEKQDTSSLQVGTDKQDTSQDT